MDENFKITDLLNYAWQYFEMHAKQRITVFNFYIVVAGFLTTGVAASFDETKKMHVIGVVLGLMLAFISFVFWKMDLRVKFMIENSENALKRLEQHFPKLQTQVEPGHIQLFRFEAIATSTEKRFPKNILNKQLSYSQCFNLVFAVFGFFGLGGALASLGLEIFSSL